MPNARGRWSWNPWTLARVRLEPTRVHDRHRLGRRRLFVVADAAASGAGSGAPATAAALGAAHRHRSAGAAAASTTAALDRTPNGHHRSPRRRGDCSRERRFARTSGGHHRTGDPNRAPARRALAATGRDPTARRSSPDGRAECPQGIAVSAIGQPGRTRRVASDCRRTRSAGRFRVRRGPAHPVERAQRLIWRVTIAGRGKRQAVGWVDR